MESAPPPAPPPREPAVWITVPLAAVLAGLAAGWQWFGFRMMATSAMDPLPATSHLLAIVALVATVAGAWLPLYVLPRLRRWAAQKNSASATTARWLHRLTHDRDESLMWTTVAILASIAGGAALLMLAMAGPLTRAYQHLLDGFFWVDATLAILEWAGTLAVTGPLWLLHGLQATTIILAAARRWPLPQAGAAVVGGEAIGWAVATVSHDYWTAAGLACEQQTMLGILPVFLLAGLAVLMAHDAGRAGTGDESPATEASETGEGKGRITWLALLIWALGLALAGAGWHFGPAFAEGSGGPHTQPDNSTHALLLAGGFIVGWVVFRHRGAHGSDCGLAVWLTGVSTGAATTLDALWPGGLSGTAQSCVLVIPAGFALAHLQTAWLAQAGRQPQNHEGPPHGPKCETPGPERALAWLITALLGGAAAGLLIAKWITLPLAGPIASMAAASMVLLVVGSLIQTFAHGPSSSGRHLGFGLIFASLAAVLTILPSDVKRWHQAYGEQSRPHSIRTDLNWLASQAQGARSFCVIGPAGTRPADYPAMLTLRFPCPPTPADLQADGWQKLHADAGRALRLDHRVYDVVYQCAAFDGPDGRHAGYSLEWLKRLAHRRSPGGMVMVDVPLEGLNGAATATIACTFEQAMNEPCVWRTVRRDGEDLLRLRTNAGLVGPDGSADPSWQPVTQLLAGREPVWVHTLRRDAISRALRTSGPAKASFPPETTRRAGGTGHEEPGSQS
ncbi:MAG TPA: hypothetical protein PKG54_17325 [Phycisphaerae bacterium]|jgi:hypothetical protein|nr:hypothetical protein [Phycisphaerae bacterium]HOB76275.1 hypothetical protein [Phycisphaerae bacterium]HOJ53669.1 hypothetical protein [Phycisphaerae bacterium]HOL26394.1 hypothetical protein [Phycisphaerae bacterium]HPP21098.1 hypothetical protein [Phycisphaerae bacterium]